MYKVASRKSLNIDITHRCPLECKRCQRFTSFTGKGLKVPGSDMLIEDFDKVTDHFEHINFCGQVSDPVHHPKFIEFLEMCNAKNLSVAVHHASAGKPIHWYPKAWAAMPNAKWWFGIDGLPEHSHNYRVHQDGPKLFEIMKQARQHLTQKPIWQYILFNYNEDTIDEAIKMANEIDVDFMLLHSSRWLGPDDELRPKNPEYSLDLKKS